MKIEFSWRYCVVGVYMDRDGKKVRFYPCPCVRITLDFGG